ncbi:hypothetical protein JD82_00379 [Prauserella rugosa]|uniref:LppA-like lipoprotein n=2 Tax=Prauserella rugosa TaxID=43354 RepID=A0A660C4U2_9PSEU|nr:hypothetical protein JD82_00379 [Prauserella rugosa]
MEYSPRKVAASLLAAISLLLLGSCGNPTEESGDTTQDTITIQRANEKLEEHMQRTREAFPEAAQFETFSHHKESPCEDPGDPGPRGRVFASLAYQIKNIPAESIKEQFSQLKEWWEKNGYRVLTEDADTLRVVSPQDEYTLGLRTNPLNELFLLGDSPCVWPNGAPQPED